MTILAYAVLVLIAFNIVSEPFLYGRPRTPYGKHTWIAAIASAAILVPLCGRVIGWW